MARAIDGDKLVENLRLIATCWSISPFVSKEKHSGAVDMLREVEREVKKAPLITPPNEWVSVDERLPDTDGAYLVYAPTYTGGSSSSLDCIGGIMFSRFKHEKWSIESGYYKRPNCVTHWMPIPTPYDIEHIHISEPSEG